MTARHSRRLTVVLVACHLGVARAVVEQRGDDEVQRPLLSRHRGAADAASRAGTSGVAFSQAGGGVKGRGRSSSSAAVRRQAGVRDGDGTPDADPDAVADENLIRSAWNGASNAFHFLDNMMPIAPMDSVAPASRVTTLGVEPLPGEHHNSLYLRPYYHVDPFPTVSGGFCNCEIPPDSPPTEEDHDWAKSVAKQLGMSVQDLPKPMTGKGKLKCTCTGEDGHKGDSFHWARTEPIPGTHNFTISPADLTYPAGNYWAPELKDGLIAPEDRLPLKDYPVQARADRITQLPAVAQEDRLDSKFVRYMDQVAAKALECEGDGVSERCVTDCRPGDRVVAQLGSTLLDAMIVSSHVGGSAIIQYTPAPAREAKSTVPCPIEAGCSPFRICRRLNSWCIEREAKHPRDFLGNMDLVLQCPAGTAVCSAIQQLVGGKSLKKGGKTCVPKGPLPPAPPPQSQ